MKKFYSLLIALLCSATIAFAKTEIDGIYYNLNDETKTAEVTSNSNKYSGDIIIPEKVTYNSTEYSVTSIGDYAFYSCSSLTSITIPNSVNSIGNYAFYECSSLTSVHISDIAAWCNIDFKNDASNPLLYAKNLYLNGEEVTNLVIQEGVTSIGSYAFYTCSSLTSITIPNSVTSIGERAFYSCSSLTSITIPNSVTSIGDEAFSSCSSLTSITIPNSVTSIGDEAFSSCSSLTSISIPNSVTSIGEYAFYNCSSLTSISIPNSVTLIGDNAFSSCSSLTSISIPNSVTSIGSYAFYYCKSLTSITIGNSVTSIGDYAFSGCSSLTSITIEATTPPTLGTSVFENTKLTAIYIPDNTLSAYKEAWGTDYIFVNSENTLTIHIETPGTLADKIFDTGQRPAFVTKLTVTGTLNDDDFTCMRETMTSLVDVDLSAITNTTGVNFNGKNNLLKILLPENLTSIGESAFDDCNYLTSITIPNSVTSIGNLTFSGCSSLTSITIPNSVTSIGYLVFQSCSSLTSISIPNSVTSIERGAFRYCSSLTSITIPNSVTSIGDGAFYNCSSLTSITIPNSVTSIGDNAFQFCSSLTSITCLGSTPPEASDLEANTSTCTLTVPKEAYNSYLRHAYWGQFLTIKAIGDKSITALSNNTDWGNVTGTGIYNVNENEIATLTATANEDYHFVKWNDEVTDNPRTVIVTQDSTFTAIFAPNTFTITTSVNNKTMGAINGGGEYAYGTEVTLTATPNEGYHFVKWSDGETKATRTIIVTADLTLIAEFVINTYNVTLNAENGVVVGAGEYAHGTEVTLTATPNEGYHFVKWSDGENNATRTIMVTSDLTLSAEFAINTYNVTLSAENGTVVGAGEYAHGTEVTLTATPNEGYHFVKWSDGETNATRTIIVTADLTLTAEFVINTYNVTLYAENGVVIGVGEYAHGTEVTLTATPNEGYHFVKWSDGETNATRTIIVTADLTLTAEFAINTYNVTLNAENGVVVGSGKYIYGAEIIIVAVANEDYKFSRWSDDNTENPRSIIITNDISLEAIFETETPKIEEHNNFIVESANETHGNVKITITAEAIEGFEFDSWSDGNTENPRIVTLDEDIELYAYFRMAQGGNPVNLETSKISSANIYTTNGTLYVEGAETDYHVLDAAGRLIYSGRDAQLQLPRGVYMVAVGGEVQKVVL